MVVPNSSVNVTKDLMEKDVKMYVHWIAGIMEAV